MVPGGDTDRHSSRGSGEVPEGLTRGGGDVIPMGPIGAGLGCCISSTGVTNRLPLSFFRRIVEKMGTRDFLGFSGRSVLPLCDFERLFLRRMVIWATMPLARERDLEDLRPDFLRSRPNDLLDFRREPRRCFLPLLEATIRTSSFSS